MTKAICIKCGKEGYLITKQSVSKGTTYFYWYVKHTANKKIKWCYIGKTVPEEYQKLISEKSSTQTGTQNTMKPNNLKSSPVNQNKNGNMYASIAQSVEQQPCKL